MNDAERWFERYLREHGFTHQYEPDLADIDTHPDFLARRGDDELVCEVKGFEEVPPLERRLEGVTQPVMVSDEEEYGPARNAVREAARQLKPLDGSPWPLLVVLANPMGFHVNLNLDRLVEAMLGNPGWGGTFNPDEGRVEGMEFQFGRDGRPRNDHPYISAVVILHERELAQEHYTEWRTEWKKTRPPVNAKDEVDLVSVFMEEQEAWKASEASKNIPDGHAYWVEVMTTGSPSAVALPESVFNGPRDRRIDVIRVAE